MNATDPQKHGAALPRILLAEDDPISARFLAAAIEACPAIVDTVATAAEAHVLALTGRHQLWLFDANLPDGNGAELLTRLRKEGVHVSALAHTAETRREPLDDLISAGFLEVLPKPIPAAMLQAAVRRHLTTSASANDHRRASHMGESSDSPSQTPTCGKLPLWDDAIALRALNGNTTHVAAMRSLFRDELYALRGRVDAALATENIPALHHELHKLQASCGFVGALQLAAAAMALQHSPESISARCQFEGSLADTLSAMPSSSS